MAGSPRERGNVCVTRRRGERLWGSGGEASEGAGGGGKAAGEFPVSDQNVAQGGAGFAGAAAVLGVWAGSEGVFISPLLPAIGISVCAMRANTLPHPFGPPLPSVAALVLAQPTFSLSPLPPWSCVAFFCLLAVETVYRSSASTDPNRCPSGVKGRGGEGKLKGRWEGR